jgi:hypothetical protein
MWFGEPHPFPERGPPTRLSTSGQLNQKVKYTDNCYASCVTIDLLCIYQRFIGEVYKLKLQLLS